MKLATGWVLRTFNCAVIATAAIALPAHAGFIALDSVRLDGNQGYTGPLGIDFNVNSAIRVTHLGTYEDDSDGFPAGVTISVGIFNRTTGALVVGSPTVTFSTGTPGVVMGAGLENRFIDVVDFVLLPGDYSIVADGYSSTEENGNTNVTPGGGPTLNNGGGLISFTGTARFGTVGQALVYPTTTIGGDPSRFDAGTFIFEDNAVSEPATLALLGLGLAGLTFRRRKLRA